MIHDNVIAKRNTVSLQAQIKPRAVQL